jgi:hypothetical protein
MMTLRRRSIAVMTALVAASCSTNTAPADQDSELEISVVRGPINPVEREGEPNSVPVAHARVKIRRLPDGAVRTVETDENGTLLLPVVSGDYTIDVDRCPTGTMFSKPLQLTVARGARTPATLICDTGIR